MKLKTAKKLGRRFERLPLTSIDTSIILETAKTDDGFYCKKFLNVVGMNCRGSLSLVVLGELFLDILGLEKYSEREDATEFIHSLIKNKKIEYGNITKSTDLVATKIKNIDSRIEQADRLILAIASERNADYFVTLDSKLLGNEKLEKELNIKIRHPRDLI